jgi:hypothetical protein
MSRETSTDALMQQVGYCLQAWSGVEYQMARLFLALHGALGMPNYFALQAAYEGVISFEARLSMLNQSILHDERTKGIFRERWNPLHNKISRMARRRAQVAHFSCIENQDAKGEFAQIRLMPFMTMTGMLSGKVSSQPLTADQLKTRASAFSRLTLRMHGFVQYVEIERGWLSADQLQVTDPVRLLHR